MAVQLQLIDMANVIIFLGLGFSGYIIFYFSQKSNPQNPVTISIFSLALGLNLIGLSHLFRVGSEIGISFIVLIPSLLGSLLTVAGIFLILTNRSKSEIYWKKRHDELQAIITNLKDKYYKQEISEDELKNVHTSLLKELAEVEVNIKQNEKK